ncbi:MAG TPA: cytochrome c, partial [Gammaproteobacteria bacterium]|nr:cytochrome c [Gammaproteobacteria bacterium]
MRALLFALVAAIVALPWQLEAQTADEPSGAAVYAQRCAACHDQVDARIPPRAALTEMSPARVLRTLDFGLMMSIAYPLTRGERAAVATFLGKGRDETTPLPSALCGPETRIMA